MEVAGSAISLVEQASAEFLGRWNHLVSTTNWEKGRIIADWRQQLIGNGAPAADSTDETWSRLVGNVSPQHVGRLRRVYQRFHATAEKYPGIFWTHFQAALDWDDAEMWLEGAVQNRWSVSEMRRVRTDARGAVAAIDDAPAAEPYDEDAPADASTEPTIFGTFDAVQDPTVGEPSTDSVPFDADPAPHAAAADVAEEDYQAAPAAPPVRPFESLAELPADLSEALERFKLAILSHKITQWQEVRPEQVLAALDALKQLVLAPSDA